MREESAPDLDKSPSATRTLYPLHPYIETGVLSHLYVILTLVRPTLHPKPGVLPMHTSLSIPEAIVPIQAGASLSNYNTSKKTLEE